MNLRVLTLLALLWGGTTWAQAPGVYLTATSLEEAYSSGVFKEPLREDQKSLLRRLAAVRELQGRFAEAGSLLLSLEPRAEHRDWKRLGALSLEIGDLEGAEVAAQYLQFGTGSSDPWSGAVLQSRLLRESGHQEEAALWIENSTNQSIEPPSPAFLLEAYLVYPNVPTYRDLLIKLYPTSPEALYFNSQGGVRPWGLPLPLTSVSEGPKKMVFQLGVFRVPGNAQSIRDRLPEELKQRTTLDQEGTVYRLILHGGPEDEEILNRLKIPFIRKN